MSATLQRNFGGGEISSLLWGRSDLALFGRSLRTMRNFFPGRQGAAVSRPGSLHLGTTKDPADTSARLIQFVLSDTESYALEVGPLYVRFWTDGGALRGSTLGEPYEVATSYVAAHLRGLKYAQTGDILTIARRGYAASELRRLPNWTFAQVQAVDALAIAAGDTAAGLIIIAGGTPVAAMAAYQAAYLAVYAAGIPSAAAQAQSAANALAAANADFAATANYLTANIAFANAFEGLFSGYVVGSPHWSFSPVVFATKTPYFAGAAGGYPVLESPLPTVDATHPAQEWIWLATLSIQETATGAILETLPFRLSASWDANAAHLPVALTDNQVALYADQPVTILRGVHLDTAAPTPNVPDTSYRELGMNIYRGKGDPSSLGIGLFGFMGTTSTGEFLDDGSEPDYARQPPRGTNPFLVYDYAGTFVDAESPSTVAFFQDRRAFGGTSRRPSTLLLSATGEYTNFDRHLYPVAGESLLFELAARRLEEVVHLVSADKLLALTRSSVWTFGGAQGPLDFDSVDARIVDEVGAIDVVPLIVDGSVLFGRAKGSGVRALRTDQGGNYRGSDISWQSDHLFIGNGAQFDVFGATRALVDWTYAEDPWGLVWAVREDGGLLSMAFRGGEAGWSRHDSFSLNGSAARYQSVCAVPEGDEDAVYVLVRRALATGGWTTCVERMTSRMRRLTADDDACVDCALRYEGPPATTITGLGHLAGESVYAVAVGNAPQGPLVVSVAGEIQLPEMPTANKGAAVVMFVGLLFTPELETLDAVSADSKLKHKTVTRVGFEVDQSAGILGGQDFEHLTETRPNTVASGYSSPIPGTQLLILTPTRTWGESARAVLRQSLPLPVTVVGLVRELDVGG